MRRRLLASYLLLTLCVLLALEVPLAFGYEQRRETELESLLLRDAFAVASAAEDTLEGAEEADLQLLAERYSERTEARAVIVDRGGLVVADSAGLQAGKSYADREEFAAALVGDVRTGQRTSDTLGTGLIYAAVPVASGEVHGAVRLTFSTGQLDRQVRRYWVTLSVIGAVSLAAAAAMGIAFARWVARPLDRVRVAASDLGQGDLAARAPAENGPPEVRQLAEAFNATASRLEQLITAQEQFVADASHQLRTPLTALRLRLEVAADEARELSPVRADLEAALVEVQRLSRLVDGLLALARAERGDPGADAVVLAVGPVLVARAEAWAALASEQGVIVDADPAGSLAVRVGVERIDQVIDNLIANAVDASRSGDTVRVTARPVTAPDGTAVVEIHVIDRGVGLSPEDRTRAFDRFWRASAPPSAGSFGGSGLGLAIVAKLCAADGGVAELREGPDGGTDAVVTYPADPPPPGSWSSSRPQST